MTTQQPMTMEQMTQEFLRLKAENERLKANKTTSGGIKVSPKGAVSVYGLGRFPVTLYASQWSELFAKSDEIAQFISNNTALLKTKETAQ